MESLSNVAGALLVALITIFVAVTGGWLLRGRREEIEEQQREREIEKRYEEYRREMEESDAEAEAIAQEAIDRIDSKYTDPVDRLVAKVRFIKAWDNARRAGSDDPSSPDEGD